MSENETKTDDGNGGLRCNDGLGANGACVWREDEEEGTWYACDAPEGGRNIFTFEVAGPDENNFTFCPYCGKKLAAVYA